MVVQNSQLAGLLLAGTFFIAFLGLTIWQRIKYPKRKGQKSDPIAEAEVYMAYGQDKQAIELLKKAQRENPNRMDIGEKLDELSKQP
ncbi:FimV family protein (plasmid) [Methylomonas sp. HW2-6]|uniref:type IV pilus assembly protein FimV n=1 Tax=Methylomonas sp. HW2-6 TaxID=3376687 RepID=UPI004040FB23